MFVCVHNLCVLLIGAGASFAQGYGGRGKSGGQTGSVSVACGEFEIGLSDGELRAVLSSSAGPNQCGKYRRGCGGEATFFNMKNSLCESAEKATKC